MKAWPRARLRSELKIDGQPLPWSSWAAEFAGKLPDEIKALEEEISAGSVEDQQETIRDRLRPLRHLFRSSRYRPTRNGAVNIGDPDAQGRPKSRGRTQEGDEDDGWRGRHRRQHLRAVPAAAGS